MNEDRVQFGGSPHRLRGWILFLLDEMTRLGLSPVTQERMHLLLFFSAVLTPIHGLSQPVPKILRHRRGPFYPEGQDELLRLLASGFIVSPTRSSVHDEGWESSGYSIAADGVQVANRLKQSAWGWRTAAFVRDLVESFAELDPTDADTIIEQDAVFGNGVLRRGEISDIYKDNRTLSTARAIADYDVDGLKPTPRDSIALYFDYLKAKRAA